MGSLFIEPRIIVVAIIVVRIMVIIIINVIIVVIVEIMRTTPMVRVYTEVVGAIVEAIADRSVTTAVVKPSTHRRIDIGNHRFRKGKG